SGTASQPILAIDPDSVFEACAPGPSVSEHAGGIGFATHSWAAHVPAKHGLGLVPRVESGSPARTCANKGIHGALRSKWTTAWSMDHRAIHGSPCDPIRTERAA